MHSCSECKYWLAFPPSKVLTDTPSLLENGGMCNRFAVYSEGNESCSKFTPRVISRNETDIDPLKGVNEKRDAILKQIFGD
jgi:hypothetical protein